MFAILRARIAAGTFTGAYPREPELAPSRFRGRPALDTARCECDGACVTACPTEAIAVRGAADERRTWEVDLARCVFCGLCADACPAIEMTGDFELAARDRRALVRSVELEPVAGAYAARVEPAATPDETMVASRFSARLRSLLRRSLHIRHLDAGSDNSTDWELAALLNPVYDVQRLGIDFVASPRHADVLLVTGAVTRNLEVALRTTYEAMPDPRIVVAVGAEACGGGVVRGSYAVAGGVDRCLPVDVYVPGDPPRPQAIIWGLLLAMDRLPSRRS